jgi:hypothetical protein
MEDGLKCFYERAKLDIWDDSKTDHLVNKILAYPLVKFSTGIERKGQMNMGKAFEAFASSEFRCFFIVVRSRYFGTPINKLGRKSTIPGQ